MNWNKVLGGYGWGVDSQGVGRGGGMRKCDPDWNNTLQEKLLICWCARCAWVGYELHLCRQLIPESWKNFFFAEIMVRRDFANRHRLWVNIWQNMIRKGLEARTEEHMVGYKLNQPTIPCRNMSGWSICYVCQLFKTSKGSCPQWHSLIFSYDFLVFVLGVQVPKLAGVICSGPLLKNIFGGFRVAKMKEGGAGL